MHQPQHNLHPGSGEDALLNQLPERLAVASGSPIDVLIGALKAISDYLLNTSYVLFDDKTLWHAPPSGRPTLLDACTSTAGIAFQDDLLFQIHADGEIFICDASNKWTSRGPGQDVLQMAVGGNAICRLRKGGLVEICGLFENHWYHLDASPDNVGVAGNNDGLYLIRKTGAIYRVPSNWHLQLIGQEADTKSVTTTARDVYRIRHSGVIERLHGSGNSWQAIDANPKSHIIYGHGLMLTQIHDDGSLFLYTAQNNAWNVYTIGDMKQQVNHYFGDLKSRYDATIDKAIASLPGVVGLSPLAAWGSAAAACAPAALSMTGGQVPSSLEVIGCTSALIAALVASWQAVQIANQPGKPPGQVPSQSSNPRGGHDSPGDHGNGSGKHGTVTVCHDDGGGDHCVGGDE